MQKHDQTNGDLQPNMERIYFVPISSYLIQINTYVNMFSVAQVTQIAHKNWFVLSNMYNYSEY